MRAAVQRRDPAGASWSIENIRRMQDSFFSTRVRVIQAGNIRAGVKAA